jgi:hypothetical protein
MDSFLWKNALLFALLLIDMIVNGMIDHQDANVQLILMVAAQFITRLMLMFSMFTMMWSTFLVRHGLVSVPARLVVLCTHTSRFLTMGSHLRRRRSRPTTFAIVVVAPAQLCHAARQSPSTRPMLCYSGARRFSRRGSRSSTTGLIPTTTPF